MRKLFSVLFALFMGVSMMATENLVLNGNFENGTDEWTVTFQNAADSNVYQVVTTDGLQVSQTTAASGRVDISQDVPVEKNASYTLSFEYKATHKKFRLWSFLVSENDRWVYFTDDAKTDSMRTYNGYFEASAEWTTISYPFNVPDVDTISTFRLMFRAYKQAGCTIGVRNISVVKQGSEDTPTGLNEVIYQSKYEKFIKEGVLYLKKEDMVYDITGKRIK